MSFFLDVILILILAGVAAIYFRRSIFAAATGAAALALAAVGASLLVGVLAPPVAENLIAPPAERSVANELADMFSAPHLDNGRDTVADLPLGHLVGERPEAYLHLLEEYSVSPEAVEAAWRSDPRPVTLLTAVTREYAAAFARSLVLLILTAVFTLILRLIAHRLEENLPPQRAYKGFKRVLPGLIGLVAGVFLLWTLVPVIGWLTSAAGGKTLILSPSMTRGAEWYSLLRMTDPLLLLL